MRTASTTTQTPAAVAITSAIIDASSPNGPPDSSSGPLSLASTKPVAVDAGHGDVENLALGEIPRRVQADRHPQAAGQHVGAAEQHARLDRDREGREPGRIGVADSERAPNKAEVSSSAAQLPPNSSIQRNRMPRNSSSSVNRRVEGEGDDRGNERAKASPADDIVDVEDRRDPDHRGDDQESGEQSEPRVAQRVSCRAGRRAGLRRDGAMASLYRNTQRTIASSL